MFTFVERFVLADQGYLNIANSNRDSSESLNLAIVLISNARAPICIRRRDEQFRPVLEGHVVSIPRVRTGAIRAHEKDRRTPPSLGRRW